MQEKHLFEYAVIRIVPRVERGEFINVGVILYSQSLRFLEAKIEVNENRLLAFSSGLDLQEVKDSLQACCTICVGGTLAGPIGKLALASRFRWLTATRSTIIQTSPVHLGLCTDANETLLRLFEQLVLV